MSGDVVVICVTVMVLAMVGLAGFVVWIDRDKDKT